MIANKLLFKRGYELCKEKQLKLKSNMQLKDIKLKVENNTPKLIDEKNVINGHEIINKSYNSSTNA